jgi:hypothetical protein
VVAFAVEVAVFAGAAGYRVGRHVRYRRSAVDAWLETQTDQHTIGR